MVSFEAISGFITSALLMMEKILSKTNFNFCKENNKDLYEEEMYLRPPNR